MRLNRLQLNADKTELLWCSTAWRQDRRPSTPMHLGGFNVQPSACVRDVSVYVDAHLSMRRHIHVVVARCFGALRHTRCVRQYVTQPPCSRRCCHWFSAAWITGTANRLACRRLNHVQCPFRTSVPVHYAVIWPCNLVCFHWLRVPELNQFKVALKVYCALNGNAPAYLTACFIRASSSPRSTICWYW